MKYFISVICCLLVVCGCKLNHKEQLKANVILGVKINPYTNTEVDTGKIYTAEFSLVNNSSARLFYWIPNCSWQSNWISEDHSFIFWVDCPTQNLPVIRFIDPHDKIQMDAIIELVSSNDSSKKEKFRFGFVLIRKEEVENLLYFDDTLLKKIKLQKDIFWSEYFKLN